ncbi:leucine-rich repeat transmembrane neuronal protein 2 [Ornithorhynchus anatinus]|uniref:Leucine rich repeat transmembrane neuronal 2 n=1 Tax=Ornithorhynchus anatinus TaxID=9258 RepID=A0A6I8NCR0_ORNAN|nr:leucine-rich repeat transmembrane neuronal protein 2 [Ornithorhynchus anatinus]
MGLHLKWPLGARMLAALYAMSVVLKMLPASGTACPPRCRCENLLFYCDSQGFRSVPNATEPGPLGLSLRHNRLSELRGDEFAGFAHLTWLNLDHNQIAAVREDAFQGLYKLKELILSTNKIAHLPNTTFGQLLNLHHLDLSSNQLASLHPELFYGLRKLRTLHLRANALRTVPVRLFWDCRGLEFLDLSSNRLRSLARNGFAGLVRLRELHLERNQLTRLNLAHFLRLTSLHTLFLQWNKIANLTCAVEWTWATLEKLDLTGNALRAVDPAVFDALPNLKVLLLDHNQLGSLEAGTFRALGSLTTVGLSGNLWECGPGICPLAAWLGGFRGRWEHAVLCHAPDHAQGEDILDAVHGFRLCRNGSAPAPAATSPAPDRGPTADPAGRMSSSGYHAGGREPPTAAATPDGPFPEPDGALFTQRVITGTMALLFSFFFIIFMVFISRKCCPPALRRIRRFPGLQSHRQLRSQTRLHAAGASDQGPYDEYEPAHEGPFIIINGYGQCKCQQLPYKECEV